MSSGHPELSTPRLRLRQFRAEDFDAYARMTADPETMRYIGDGVPFTRDEAWRSLSYVLGHWELRGFGLWAAEEKDTGALVGRIGLIQPEGWPGLEVGWMVERTRQGEGFATEGGEASLRFALEALGVEQVVSLIQPDNAASIRVAEKLGEKLLRHIEHDGKPVLLYGIDMETWEEARSEPARAER